MFSELLTISRFPWGLRRFGMFSAVAFVGLWPPPIGPYFRKDLLARCSRSADAGGPAQGAGDALQADRG
jgi:hypothetical protein